MSSHRASNAGSRVGAAFAIAAHEVVIAAFTLVLVVLLVVTVAACGPTRGATAPPASAAAPAATAPASPPPSTSASASLDAAASPAATASPGGGAAFDPTGVRVKVDVVATGLSDPVDVTSAWDGSGRLFVVEQPGRIRIVKDGQLADSPFLDIRDRIASGGERGLLGLAFHPDYPTDPRLFVDYTDLDGNTVVSEFRTDGADPNRADPASERILVRIDQPYPNHNGGGLAFGPDGMLYIAAGDGGSAGDPHGNGRNLDTFLAKVLRIDVDGDPAAAPYAIPSTNPFVGRSDARPEIWATGLRNPWRIRFDRATGDLWIGDVGQGAWEEIDVMRTGVGGLDFGWNTMEGDHCFEPAAGCDQAGLTLPVTEYGHDAGCAVIGGVVIRDPGQPRLDGGYLYGDTCSGNLWMLDPAGGGGDRGRAALVATGVGSLSAINEGEDGTIYATDVVSGKLLRVSAAD